MGKNMRSPTMSRQVLDESRIKSSARGHEGFVSHALTQSVESLAAAAERSFAAAEAAEDAELAASRAAQKAVEAYCAASSAVGEAEFEKLIRIARSAKGMTDNVARSAADSSKEYMRRKPRITADPHVALRATQSALYARQKSAVVASYIKVLSHTLKIPIYFLVPLVILGVMIALVHSFYTLC